MGARYCFITMIDGAVKAHGFHRFFKEETTADTMTVLSYWIRTYRIPQSLYCGRKNAFVLTRKLMDAELLAGITEPKDGNERPHGAV